MIKIPKLRIGFLLLNVGALTLISVLVDGCATKRTSPELEELAGKGPVIMNPKSTPEHLELNEFLKPNEIPFFSAEIMDTSAPVTEAQLQIANTRVVVPMNRIGGTSWRGKLTSEQIRELAINGRSIEYVGRVIARDEAGSTNVGKDPVVLSIDTPPAA